MRAARGEELKCLKSNFKILSLPHTEKTNVFRVRELNRSLEKENEINVRVFGSKSFSCCCLFFFFVKNRFSFHFSSSSSKNNETLDFSRGDSRLGLSFFRSVN